MNGPARIEDQPGTIHRFIDTWLRVHAPSPTYIPRGELVDAVIDQVNRRVDGFSVFRMADGSIMKRSSVDRIVRDLANECSDLGLPVTSGPEGYTSANPADPRPWLIADIQDSKRIRALRRRQRRRRWAREAEARRRAGEPPIVQTKLTSVIPPAPVPAGMQGRLFA